ncbi:MAG: NrsF family protein [Thermoanaerobaculum sp.]|nr:NrsF family protein [Thermoanaerobaculum sp.]
MNQELPPRLRLQVAQDLRPVRPVAAPSVRLVLVILWVCALLIAGPALLGLRFNAPRLGFWLLWGATLAEALAGLVLIFLALREGIPGLGAPRSTLALALGGAVVVELGVALLTHARCPCPPMAGMAGLACFAREAVLGLPALLLTLWLVVRAYPLSPSRAGLLGGVGAGVLADAVQHLVCPVSDPRHVLIWHLGAVGVLGILGFVAGLWWQARRLRDFATGHEDIP